MMIIYNYNIKNKFILVWFSNKQKKQKLNFSQTSALTILKYMHYKNKRLIKLETNESGVNKNFLLIVFDFFL